MVWDELGVFTAQFIYGLEEILPWEVIVNPTFLLSVVFFSRFFFSLFSVDRELNLINAIFLKGVFLTHRVIYVKSNFVEVLCFVQDNLPRLLTHPPVPWILSSSRMSLYRNPVEHTERDIETE